MIELRWLNPTYLIRGDAEETGFYEAHRVFRMAVGLACFLDLPGNAGGALVDIEERIGHAEPERFFTLDEVAILAEALAVLHGALREGLDERWRPRGPYGERIRWEATEMYVDPNDTDRIFAIAEDGTVYTVNRRLGLPEYLDRLAGLAAYFRTATSRGCEIVVLDV